MASTEWELLTIAEDIEVGDTVAVENEDGDTVPMVFMSLGRKGVVTLMDREGENHLFSQDSLEEIGGYSVITGKSEEELSAKQILRNR